MSDPLKKALMEVGRLVLIALVSAILTVGASYVASQELSEGWLTAWLVLSTLLKALDKFLHELGKEEKNDTLTLGLTRF